MDTQRLEAELAGIRSRFGTIDCLTADEIVSLVDACRRADAPFGDADRELLDIPAAVVRGFEFRPLTIGASVWLDEFAAKWWGEDDNRYFWALVYALVHGHQRAAFTSLTSEDAARRAIRRMSLHFAFGRAALEKAVDAALGRPDPNASTDSEPMDWSAVVAQLEAATGIRRDEWLWGRSERYTMRAYSEMRRLVTMRSGGKARRMLGALDRALQRLAEVKHGIKARLEAKRKEATA
jgi:hypothetical protein